MRNVVPPRWLLLLGLLSIAGCTTSAPGATMEQLQRRAWLDSGCRADQLMLLHVDTRTKALEGCGRRLIYVESCEHIRGEHACTWVLDSASEATGTWGGMQAPTSSGVHSYGPQPTQTSRPIPPRPTAPPVDDIPPPAMSSPLPSEYMPTHL